MNAIGKLIASVTATAAVCAAALSAGVAAGAETEFDKGRMLYVEKSSGSDFVILQFTDTHVQSAVHGRREVFPVMSKWVEEVNPDMIVVAGDGVNGTADGNDMKALISAMNGYERPWAYVFGNHEKDGGLGIRGNSAILREEAMRDGTYLLYDEGVFTEEGRYGNYVVNVEQRGKIVYSLFFFDSGREYETFLPSQTKWYEEGVKALSETYCGKYSPFEGKVVPSMVFHHIPTDEYQYAANAVLTDNYVYTEEDKTEYSYEKVKVGKVPAAFGSGANWEFSYGQRDARVKNARIHNTAADKALKEYAMYEDERSEAGFVSVVKDLHSTTHLFCGHRHTNDATITFEGLTYTFGTKTGPGNSVDGRQSGCTAITIADKTAAVKVEHKYNREG